MTKISDWKPTTTTTEQLESNPYEVLVFLDDVIFGCIIAADEEKGVLVQRIKLDGQNVQITRKGKVKILVNGVPVSKILVESMF